MQGVGAQRLAGVRPRHAPQHACAEEVDDNRCADDRERGDACFHRMRLHADQPLQRLPNHDRRQQEQQAGLGQGSDAFDLAVAVLMLGVGRLAGNAYGEIGEYGRRQVNERVAGLRQNRQRAGEQPDHRLGCGQPRRGGDRPERSFFLLVHPPPFAPRA